MKSNEYKQMERTGELSIMTEAKIIIDEVLKDEPTVKDFVESLQSSGLDVRPNISEKTGKMNGFSFKKDEIKFKSSAIAKNYSWQNLQKNGLQYDHERDTEFLIGVKNEFTEKLSLESGRDRGIETAKSVDNQAESITKRTESEIDRPESAFGKTDRREVESNRNQIARYAHYDSKLSLMRLRLYQILWKLQESLLRQKYLTMPFMKADIEENQRLQKLSQERIQEMENQLTALLKTE